jgi:glucokinase-like ROK family protein
VARRCLARRIRAIIAPWRPAHVGVPDRGAARIEFEAGAGHILVADLGATSIDVAVTDLAARIHSHLSEPADIAAGPDAVLSRVDELLAEVLRSAGDATGPLWGVGIGVPGPVEFRTGRPISPPIMPGWDGYPIRERFAERFDAPVWVDNDVNVMALGEWRAGVAQGHANVIFIKVGTGIGAGLISDGLLHRGSNGAAGDVGQIQVVDDRSIICRCGYVGCLEAVAGGAALARDGERAAREGRSPLLARALEADGVVTAATVGRAAEHGDPVSVERLQEAGRRIGMTLASIVNFFNPSLVVVGGGVANSGDQLLATIRQSVYGRSLPLATRELLVRRSSLAGRSGVIGAASMVVDQLFARETLGRWIPSGSPAGRPEIVDDDPVVLQPPVRAATSAAARDDGVAVGAVGASGRRVGAMTAERPSGGPRR